MKKEAHAKKVNLSLKVSADLIARLDRLAELAPVGSRGSYGAEALARGLDSVEAQFLPKTKHAENTRRAA